MGKEASAAARGRAAFTLANVARRMRRNARIPRRGGQRAQRRLFSRLDRYRVKSERVQNISTHRSIQSVSSAAPPSSDSVASYAAQASGAAAFNRFRAACRAVTAAV